MAFKKTGDALPVLEYYDDDGIEQKCPKCGRGLIVISAEQNNNKLICECCDFDDNGEKNDD